MSLRRAALSLLTVSLSLCLFAASASAQDGGRTVIIFTPGLSSTTTTGVVLTVWDATTSSTSSTSDTLFGSCVHATLYFQQNATALEQAVALGAGESLEDLAQLAHIAPEDQAAFNQLLNARRGELLPLLSDPDFSEQHTRQISALILDAMRADARLSRYVAS